jgi:hypothetical protein
VRPLRLSSVCALSRSSHTATPHSPPQKHVYIKRTDNAPVEGEVFAKLEMLAGDAVADLAERACAKFGWGVPTRARLYLVKHKGELKPLAEAEARAALLDEPALRLERAGVVSGSWLLARVSLPAAAAGAPPSGSATARWTADRLRTALAEAGIAVEEAFIRRVIGSRALQNSLTFCSSTADVAAFHALALTDPQSETRANVLGDSGVAIDGDIVVPHRTTALFKWAFVGAMPYVLKLPQGADAAMRECRLIDAVGAAAAAAGVPLVPVRLLRLCGSHRVGEDVTLLRAAVLMPAYPVTLAAAPVAVTLRHGARLFARLEVAVDFLASRGWVHGDVKPSNIFLAGDGEPWLGDFGSSMEVAHTAATFRGGTPQFQLDGIAAAAPDAAFDRAGLVISFVDAAGLLRAGSRDALPWPRSVIEEAVGRLAAEFPEAGTLPALLDAALRRACDAAR